MTDKKQEEFLNYYEQFGDKIYSFVYYRSGGNQAVAEDLTSEIFLKALSKFASFKGVSFKGWIYMITRNHLKDYYRKHKVEVSLDEAYGIRSELDDPNTSTKKQLAAEDVSKLVAQLPQIQQDCIILKYFNHRSFKEIAEITGKSEANVRVIAHRALKQLKNYLTPNI